MRVRSHLAILVVSLFISAAAFAGELAGDNQALLDHLARTEGRFLAAVEGLTEAQWNYKPAPDRWSIAECAEHIAASEPFIRDMVAKSLETPAEGDDAKKDDLVLGFLLDRSKKFDAPEPLAPNARFGSPAATVEAFRKERAETVKLASGGRNFRASRSDHFGFGPLDSHGWMLFLSGHTERHTLQIEEVKASEGFPKE